MRTLRSSVQSGLTTLELTIVIALVGALSSIALLSLSKTTTSADLQAARSMVAAAIRRASAQSARSGVTAQIDLQTFPIASSVRVGGSVPTVLPEGSTLCTTVELQGGTGYPFSDGRNVAVAVLLSSRTDSESCFAVVLGRSATVTVYRLNRGQWEVTE